MQNMPNLPEDLNEWVILIVDDYLDNVIVAQMTLEFYGVKVLIAYNGREGLEILKDTTPTAILIDLSMPIMDGWDFLLHARKLPQIDQTPIIAVTAHALKNDRSRALEAGFDAYVAKPYEVAELVPLIDKTIKARQEPGKNATPTQKHDENDQWVEAENDASPTDKTQAESPPKPAPAEDPYATLPVRPSEEEIAKALAAQVPATTESDPSDEKGADDATEQGAADERSEKAPKSDQGNTTSATEED